MAIQEQVELLKQGAEIWNRWRFANPSVPIDLQGAILMIEDFFSANLREADLRHASLLWTKLEGANLDGADLSFANLQLANLFGASMRRTKFNNAQVGHTVFANVDSSEVTGLETVTHYNPSVISIDTLYKSQGKIPDKFLRDAGIPEEIIGITHSIRNGPPI